MHFIHISSWLEIKWFTISSISSRWFEDIFRIIYLHLRNIFGNIRPRTSVSPKIRRIQHIRLIYLFLLHHLKIPITTNIRARTIPHQLPTLDLKHILSPQRNRRMDSKAHCLLFIHRNMYIVFEIFDSIILHSAWLTTTPHWLMLFSIKTWIRLTFEEESFFLSHSHL